MRFLEGDNRDVLTPVRLPKLVPFQDGEYRRLPVAMAAFLILLPRRVLLGSRRYASRGLDGNVSQHIGKPPISPLFRGPHLSSSLRLQYLQAGRLFLSSAAS